VGNFVSFVANLLQYLSAKNYQNTVRFDKVIANIKRCNFFLPHSVWRKRNDETGNDQQSLLQLLTQI